MPTPFETYGNFEFKEKDPALPVKDSKEISEGKIETRHSTFSSNVILDDENILKITRQVTVKPGKKGLDYGLHVAKPTLAEREEGRVGVLEKLRRLAKEKLETYELAGKYVGPYLPELRGFAVVESPRQFLEDSAWGPRLEEDQYDKLMAEVPKSEIALMEIWENVHPNQEISYRSWENLKGLYSDEEFRRDLADFADRAFRLFVEKEKELDLVGPKGILCVTPHGSQAILGGTPEELHKLLSSSDDEVIPLPRNMTHLNGKIKFYDLYPMLSTYIVKESALTLAAAIRSNDLEFMKHIAQIENDEERNTITYGLRYLALLRKMGSSLELK